MLGTSSSKKASGQFFLSSTVHEENDRLVAHLTNPDLLDGARVAFHARDVPPGRRKVSLAGGLLPAHPRRQPRPRWGDDRPFESGSRPTTLTSSRFAASIDQPDAYCSRALHADQVILGYHGLDDVVRRTFYSFSPVPALSPRRGVAGTWRFPRARSRRSPSRSAASANAQPQRLLALVLARDQAAAEHGH